MIRNTRWIIAGVVTAHALLLMNFALGSLKNNSEIDWLDIVGEGGASVLMLVWWWFLLIARPAGKVSNFILSGVYLLFLGSLQDAIDEFIQLSEYAEWLSDLESILLPLGMLLLTIGLFYWKEEQKVIDKLLLSRERFVRDHWVIDNVTQLADIRYLKENIKKALARSEKSQEPFTLLLIDLDDFHSVNRQYGFSEGDYLLQKVAELLLLNVRDKELVCRFAGDRYALLLENTNKDLARLLLEDTLNLINNYKHRTQYGERVTIRASGGIASYLSGDENELFEKAKLSLFQAKEVRKKTTFASA